MFKTLSRFLLGSAMSLLLVVNTCFWAVPLYVMIFLKLLTPVGSRARDLLSRAASALAQNWAVCNT